MKIINGESSKIKFLSKDEILQEVMEELLQEKENSVPTNVPKHNSKNQKNVKAKSNVQVIAPSEKIRPEEIIGNYIKKYCEKYKGSEEVKIDDLVNKIRVLIS